MVVPMHPDVLTGNEISPYTYGGRKATAPAARIIWRRVQALFEHYWSITAVIWV
jgi:hypothetical protein